MPPVRGIKRELQRGTVTDTRRFSTHPLQRERGGSAWRHRCCWGKRRQDEGHASDRETPGRAVRGLEPDSVRLRDKARRVGVCEVFATENKGCHRLFTSRHGLEEPGGLVSNLFDMVLGSRRELFVFCFSHSL